MSETKLTGLNILDEIKAGRLVVVPREMTAEMVTAYRLARMYDKGGYGGPGPWEAALTASCDHTAGLIALVEGVERERDEAEQALRTVQNAAKTIASAHGTELEHLRQNARFDHALRAEVESIRQHGSEMTDALLAAEARALAAEAERDALREALSEIVKADTHLVWSGGSVREPSHDELGECAQIAARALTEKNNG